MSLFFSDSRVFANCSYSSTVYSIPSDFRSSWNDLSTSIRPEQTHSAVVKCTQVFVGKVRNSI